MYRGTPYLNRNIRKRQQQKSMQYHMNNLTHIRPRTGTIDSNNEVQINNKKKQMQKQARFTEIQRQNRILLEKISSIMGKQSRRTQSQNRINRSLNSQLRKRQLQNIQIQNAKLLRRLQQKRPNYQTQKFKQSWRKQKQVIKNLSNYPFVISDKKRKRVSVSQIGGRQTKMNVIQLCRMRIIDGVSFLMTIRLNQQKLQIIGDTKDKKQLKVIQIQRKQAIQFIQQQCKGKIQNMFNCLRYDKVDEVLYLVANDVQLEDMKNQSPSRLNQKKREENPQFDISIQNEEQNKNGSIPIHVTNGVQNKQYWVEVDRKKTEKFNANHDQDFRKQTDHHEHEQQQQENKIDYNQFQEQNQNIQKKTIEQHSQRKPKLQQGVNTYEKIRKVTEQSNKKGNEHAQNNQETKSIQNKIQPKSEVSRNLQKSMEQKQSPLKAENKSRQVSESYGYEEFQEENKGSELKYQQQNDNQENQNQQYNFQKSGHKQDSKQFSKDFKNQEIDHDNQFQQNKSKGLQQGEYAQQQDLEMVKN